MRLLEVFEEKELKLLHEATLQILQNPGMKIMGVGLLKMLKDRGLKVNESAHVVRFSARLIEETIQLIRKEIRSGKKQNILNGVISSRTKGKIQAKFGGACSKYFDWEKKVRREPTGLDLVNLVQLGESIPEVATVGNPVIYIREEKDGSRIDPRLQRVKTAALIAKNTSKAGPTEVMNPRELEFLVAMGEVVRGGPEKYQKNPCFITAKETISPLVLSEEAGEVLLALAEKGLPCTILPMPLAGASSPVTSASNIVIANAEILGTMTAIKLIFPEAAVAGGVITGILDMSTGSASFAAPEAILQDLGIAELYEKLYGLDLGIGTGYIDAKLPGAQASAEKELKFIASALSGRVNYPVGLLDGGRTFSGEQALIDLEIARYIHQFLNGVDVSPETLMVDLIRKVGIGGHFLEEKHTLENFRKVFWFPEIFERGLDERDILEKAHQRFEEILVNPHPYQIGKEESREIDKIVKSAEKALLE